MLQLAICFEAEADGVADVLVGLAEGDALVGEIGGGGHGVEVAGFGGGLHAVVAELKGIGEVPYDIEDAECGFSGFKYVDLTLLKVFVVSEWQAFEENAESSG